MSKMKTGNEKETRNQLAYAFFGAAILFLIYASLRTVNPLSNMTYFVVGCVLFLAAAFGICLALNKGSIPESAQKVLNYLSVICVAAWMFIFYLRETDAPHPVMEEKLVRRMFFGPVWFLMMAAGTLICVALGIFLAAKTGKKEGAVKDQAQKTLPGKVPGMIRVLISLVFTFVTAKQFYAPNILLDDLGNLYHSHPYTNTIINVCWMVPYSEKMSSIYGHYAVLYMPFVKAFHSIFKMAYIQGIFVMNAVFAGISILAFLYVLNHFVKNDVLYYLAMLGIGEQYYMIMTSGVYMQVHPHRVLFAALILATAVWGMKHEEMKKAPLIESVMAVIWITLSLIWSMETGIVVMLGYVGYRFVSRNWDGDGFSLKKLASIWKDVTLFAVVPFVLGYLAVNFYNVVMAAGGKLLSLEEYLFPLISDQDYVSYLETELPGPFHYYVLIGILFLCFSCLPIIEMLLGSGEKSKRKQILFFASVEGLGLMLYYVNRPAEGSMAIVIFELLIVVGTVAQKMLDHVLAIGEKEELSGNAIRKWFAAEHIRTSGIGLIAAFVLFCMAFDSVYSMPHAIRCAQDTIWRYDELQAFMEEIYVAVPPDAYAFGSGVPEIMSVIDRDTFLHSTDYSDIKYSIGVLDDLLLIKDKPWFFCNINSLQEMLEYYPDLTDDFDLHDTYSYGNYTFGLFYHK